MFSMFCGDRILFLFCVSGMAVASHPSVGTRISQRLHFVSLFCMLLFILVKIWISRREVWKMILEESEI